MLQGSGKVHRGVYVSLSRTYKDEVVNILIVFERFCAVEKVESIHLNGTIHELTSGYYTSL